MKRIIFVALAWAVCGTVFGESVTYPTYNKYIVDSGKATANPSTWGTLNCHDPEIFQDDDGSYYVFSTDASIGGAWKGGIQIRKSSDLVHWTTLDQPAITHWDPDMLRWLGETANTATSWAPAVTKRGGEYFLYHGVMVSTDATGGEPRGWIGLAKSKSVTGPYEPVGPVVRYSWSPDSDDVTKGSLNGADGSWNRGFGTIDPSLVTDTNGDLWMTYGSWKGGIAILRLDNSTGLPLVGAPADMKADGLGTKIAGGLGAAYEGATVVNIPSSAYYYLFMSCGDLETDYSVRVGRRAKADGIAGPYFDSNGWDLTKVDSGADSDGNFHSHGNKILGSRSFKGELGWRAPGGPSVLQDKDGKVFLAVHSRTNFQPGYYFYLQIFELKWTSDGWPVADPNEYSATADATPESKDLVGTWDAIQTKRDAYYGEFTDRGGKSFPWVNTTDAEETVSQLLNFGADGKVSGARNGTWEWKDGEIRVNLDASEKLPAGVWIGKVFRGIDGARKGTRAVRETWGLSAFCAATGEYLIANWKK